jgi:hypothetical protein
MPLTIIDCKVTTNSIELTFSDTIASKEDYEAWSTGAPPAIPTGVWKGWAASPMFNWASGEGIDLPTGGWLFSSSFPTPPTAANGYSSAAMRKLYEHLKHSALNPNNYVISDPRSADFGEAVNHAAELGKLAGNVSTGPWSGSKLPLAPTGDPGANFAWVAVDESRTKITIFFVVQPAASPEFFADSWVNIVVKNIWGMPEAGDDHAELEEGFALVVRQVPPSKPGMARKVRDFEDAISYPLLTEEVGYPPSPVSRPSGGGFGGGSGGGQSLGLVASAAIGDVLGWKANAADSKGFITALTQSFTLTETEGRVEHKWNPKSYTVQTDLAGGITGAQASLYARAQVAQEKCLPLLDGLYALDPRADPEYVKALREIAKSQITEIVKQFGVVPPSILRVNTYFHILLGVERKHLQASASGGKAYATVETNPDRITGTLGDIRKIYGIYFQKDGKDNPLSNSVEDEQNITNFRVVSDYMTSLLLTWLGNYEYFKLTMGKAPAFLGTQLILIGRQFNVIAETVNEVRFTLDSVFIGPNERQQLLLVFADHHEIPSMYLEDVLMEIEKTVSEEGPRLIKDGGRIALNNNLLPVLQTLMDMVEGAHDPVNIGELPDGFRTARVRHSLDDLRDQLTYLFSLAQQVGTQVPQPWQQ